MEGVGEAVSPAQAGGRWRLPQHFYTSSVAGRRERAVSEEMPKSPLTLSAGGGGGTRWRQPDVVMDPGGHW